MKTNRIELIDAFRGIALMGILLLHHIEHFDFFKKPDYDIAWLVSLDQWIWDGVFLLFARKSFALFSLLFGFSYWIMYENRKLKGEKYFLRHLWRMVLLFLFGLLHTIFFRGDILNMYAVIGLALVITPYLSQRTLLFLSVFLVLDPVRSYSLISHFFGGTPGGYFLSYPPGDANVYLAGDSFWEVIKFNFTTGFKVSWVWTWNVGRVMTILGLFFLGAYLAKIKAFTERSFTFWYKFLGIGISIWVLSNLSLHMEPKLIANESFHNVFSPLVTTYKRLGMMFSFVSLVTILWRLHEGKVWISIFCDFGRMGLTNYLLMSIIGAILYYGWAMGLYEYCGSTITLGIGLAALIAQMKFSTWWLSKYGQGPLERIWRKATWIKLS